jgi:hypothetical protein
LSFFDEADEPRSATRTTPRRRGGSGSGAGGGSGRPPSDQQAIMVRRVVAAVGFLVLLIVIVLIVNSCQNSARNSALKDYNNSVTSLIQQSDQTGASLFHLLSSGASSNVSGLQNSLDQARVDADSQLAKAKAIDVPDEMKPAQVNLLLALQMRRDAIANIASEIQPALGTSTSKDAVNAIAAQMARAYASDVVYKDYTTPEIAKALHGAGIAVGGTNGETIENGQFVTDLAWLQPATVASRLGAHVSTASGKPTPGLHGHTLDSVNVGSNNLDPSVTNTVTANPAPTFTLHLTNGGQHDETNVVCKVTISGSTDTGQTVIPTTTQGQSTTCNVKLNSVPPTGAQQVTATVEPVPGEKTTSNNSLTFPITFQ